MSGGTLRIGVGGMHGGWLEGYGPDAFRIQKQ
jgi:hypothetical protein